jgi:hypothetical protein
LAAQVCFTPVLPTNCDIYSNGGYYYGTIDTAASSNPFGHPLTVEDWLYWTQIRQYWPGTKRPLTFWCIIGL